MAIYNPHLQIITFLIPLYSLIYHLCSEQYVERNPNYHMHQSLVQSRSHNRPSVETFRTYLASSKYRDNSALVRSYQYYIRLLLNCPAICWRRASSKQDLLYKSRNAQSGLKALEWFVAWVKTRLVNHFKFQITLTLFFEVRSFYIEKHTVNHTH